jgi:hypothetical protein
MPLSLRKGASFHCYAGEFWDQESFISADPSKEASFTIYFLNSALTIYRCTLPSVRVPSVQTGGLISSGTCTTCESRIWIIRARLTSNRFVGSTSYNSRTVLFWNLALQADGSPELPGSDSCNPGCRPVVSIDNNQWFLNEECQCYILSTVIVLLKMTYRLSFGTQLSHCYTKGQWCQLCQAHRHHSHWYLQLDTRCASI